MNYIELAVGERQPSEVASIIRIRIVSNINRADWAFVGFDRSLAGADFENLFLACRYLEVAHGLRVGWECVFFACAYVYVRHDELAVGNDLPLRGIHDLLAEKQILGPLLTRWNVVQVG